METSILAIAVAMLIAGPSFAADKLSKGDRRKMADMHAEMAACLKSDKPIEECHGEMMRSCKGMADKALCPMMGHMKGMMHDHDKNGHENNDHDKKSPDENSSDDVE